MHIVKVFFFVFGIFFDAGSGFAQNHQLAELNGDIETLDHAMQQTMNRSMQLPSNAAAGAYATRFEPGPFCVGVIEHIDGSFGGPDAVALVVKMWNPKGIVQARLLTRTDKVLYSKRFDTQQIADDLIQLPNESTIQLTYDDTQLIPQRLRTKNARQLVLIGIAWPSLVDQLRIEVTDKVGTVAFSHFRLAPLRKICKDEEQLQHLPNAI